MNFVRLLKDIPLRWNEERSDQLANGHPDGYRRIYLSADECVICPDDALVTSIWRFHFFSWGGRAEFKAFLSLAADCRRLLDVGASAGIFGALFSNTRSDAEILSVEPDEKSFRLLQETIRLNSAGRPDWQSLRVVMAARPGTQHFASAGLGGTITKGKVGEEITAHTLESLTTERRFIPECIKIDIESFEYELLASAWEWLASHRPRLFLELHWAMLVQRRRNPEELLRGLTRVGYEREGKKKLTADVCRELDRSGIVRLALLPTPCNTHP